LARFRRARGLQAGRLRRAVPMAASYPPAHRGDLAADRRARSVGTAPLSRGAGGDLRGDNCRPAHRHLLGWPSPPRAFPGTPLPNRGPAGCRTAIPRNGGAGSHKAWRESRGGGMSNASHERLRRLLLLVPYVRQHPGIAVDALAKALGLSREGLLADLDLL